MAWIELATWPTSTGNSEMFHHMAIPCAITFIIGLLIASWRKR